ncbi:MAG: hypothetical protein HY548_04660 [Elusimicrobia bacterium]|nr:hypothetical protein [Elusimicrobiota bacterium]
MGAITGTKAVLTEFSGEKKILTVTATVASSSDTITLTQATHGIGTIDAVVGAVITGGLDAAFTTIQVSYSGLVITVDSFEQDGTAATDFTGTTVAVTVVGH